MRVLFIGDIVGRVARKFAYEQITRFKKNDLVDIIIVNVENAAGGFGVTPKICEEFYNAGSDVLTSGNHIWDKKEIYSYINKNQKLLRPLNMDEGSPGYGMTIINTKFGKIGVANLMTNLYMINSNNMFECVPNILDKISLNNDLIFSLVDVHGEATSEKMALGYILDGAVSAVVGTHTHVPTSDYRILDKGTAYITDVGMSGDYNSIIGMRKEAAINRFLKVKNIATLEVSNGEPTLCGVLIIVKNDGLAKSIQPIRIGGKLDNIDLK